MRILIVHNHYLLPGGEDEVVRSEADMLRRFGHEVTLYERSNKEIEEEGLLKKLKYFFKDIYFSQRTYQEIRDIIKKNNIEIVHVHNTFLAISPSVYKACRSMNVPIVQTLHNYRFLCPVAVFYRENKICEECLTHGRRRAVINRCWKKSYFKSFALKSVVDDFYKHKILTDHIDQFIVLSEFSLKKHVINGFPEDKISIKSNFLGYDPGKAKVDSNYALYVGGLHAYKGISTLLKAWDKIEGKFTLRIVGDGPLRDEVIAKSKEGKVEFLGQKPLGEVLENIKNAAFVIVPSECYEMGPRTIIESFACGKPVIASRIGSMAEGIEDGKTGFLFEPYNADDLTQKILHMIENPNRRIEMGFKARNVFEQKYNLDNNYKILFGIYQKTIKDYKRKTN